MVRIAILFEYPTLNGGERSMLSVLDRPICRQFDFTAIAPPAGPLADALRDRGIDRVPFRLRDEEGTRLPRGDIGRQLVRTTGECGADLLHANSLSMGRLTGAIAADLDVPTIAHLRDMLKLSKSAAGDLNRNRRLIAVSQATRDYHAAQGIDAERIDVLYNGVDCELFQPRPATGWLKRELGLGDDTFLVVTIGQIGLRKGQGVLAAAATETADSLPNVHYLLVGERTSSKQESVEFEQQVIARFEQASLGGRLHRLDYRDDVAEIMNEADLLVHPAHQEPLGRVLLEAAATGLPMVATDVGGTQEIVEDGVSARLIPPGDAAALSAAMVELHRDRDLRERLAAAARVRARSAFHIEDAARGICQVWTDLTSE